MTKVQPQTAHKNWLIRNSTRTPTRATKQCGYIAFFYVLYGSLFIEISAFHWHKFQLLCSPILQPPPHLRFADWKSVEVKTMIWVHPIKDVSIFFLGGGGGLSLNHHLGKMVKLFIWGMQKYPLIKKRLWYKKKNESNYLLHRNKNLAASYGFELILTAQ